MEGATIEEIREAFGQEMIAAAARIKEHFGLPTQEAMVAIYAASSCFEEVGRKTAGWDDDTVRQLRAAGEKSGGELYATMVKQAAGPEEEDVPTLGSDEKLGIVGPDDGTGIMDAGGNEITPDAMAIEGTEVVTHVVATAVMTAKFPGGLPIHPLDSISLLAASLEFLRQQPDVKNKVSDIDSREAYARTEIRRAVAQMKDNTVTIGAEVFGPEGPATQVEEKPKGPGLVGLDGKAL